MSRNRRTCSTSPPKPAIQKGCNGFQIPLWHSFDNQRKLTNPLISSCRPPPPKTTRIEQLQQIQNPNQKQNQGGQKAPTTLGNWPRTLPRECNCPAPDFVLNNTIRTQPTTLLIRHMERQMELGGLMNTVYGIDFYNRPRFHGARPQVDAESELIQLRLLLKPHEQLGAAQQQQLSGHLERLLELKPEDLEEQLEESFHCGMLDAEQLQQLHRLMPQSVYIALLGFYRRLGAELAHYSFNLDKPQHVELLQRFLMLREMYPKPQARRLLAATMKHMRRLPDIKLDLFLEQLYPAQLQQLHQHLKCSYTQLASRQQQRLLQRVHHMVCSKRQLELHTCDVDMLMHLLTTPVDEPLTTQQRRFLQALLDHLLPMSKLDQLESLQRLPLNSSKVRRLRLILHNPALLCNIQQLKQLYSNLQQLTQLLNRPQ